MPIDIRNDLQRNDNNEHDIEIAFERVRTLFKTKALPYYELMRSRENGDLRYILTELNDKFGTIIIADLTSQKIHKYCDELNQPDGS